MFVYGHWNILRFAKMHSQCPSCKLSFEPEPGFYFGAMYISYAISVALIIGVSILLYAIWGNIDFTWYALICVGVSVFLLPFNFRFSRIVYFYLVGYKA